MWFCHNKPQSCTSSYSSLISMHVQVGLSVWFILKEVIKRRLKHLDVYDLIALLHVITYTFVTPPFTSLAMGVIASDSSLWCACLSIYLLLGPVFGACTSGENVSLQTTWSNILYHHVVDIWTRTWTLRDILLVDCFSEQHRRMSWRHCCSTAGNHSAILVQFCHNHLLSHNWVSLLCCCWWQKDVDDDNWSIFSWNVFWTSTIFSLHLLGCIFQGIYITSKGIYKILLGEGCAVCIISCIIWFWEFARSR